MTLKHGTRLGPFEIDALLGAGGMGEVYRARDERLNRDVAVKVLHSGAVGEPESHRRFAQEARAASALNHPNILTVYDVGSTDGCPYIVTELVEGESLAELIARGPVPVRKFLEIAVQLAAGLATAHATGIVHRDLKPTNVMVRRDGCVKLLDFGIAKLTQVHGGAESGETAPGMIVGTIGYLSPEQARGEALDFRSDQFSLGVTFYRMLTGKLPFERSSTLATLAALAEEEPEPIGPGVPAQVRWTVERCLSKDREGRYASTYDLYHELKSTLSHLSEITSERHTAAASAPARRRMRATVWLPISALAAGLAAGLLLAPSTGSDLSSYSLTPLATEEGYKGSPAWAPNGKDIAYSADVNGVRQIFVRGVSAPTPAQITRAPADCETPFWSPDSSTIYYRTAGKLWSTKATGGHSDVVQDDVDEAALSPQGTLAFLRADSSGKKPLSLWTATPPQSAAVKSALAPLASGTYAEGHLAFSRDGLKLGVWLARWGGRSEFWLMPLPTGAPRKAFELPQGAWSFTWMPDNRTVVFGGLVPGMPGTDLQFADTASGAIRRATFLTGDALEPTVSPRGDETAFTLSQNDFDLVQAPVDGSPMARLLATSRNELDPSWSPVADVYAYSTDRTGSAQIWIRNSKGDIDLPVVTEKDFGQAWIVALNETTFSLDGQRIAYAATGSNGHSIWISSIHGGSPQRLTSGQADQRSPSWSPDGTWIAFLERTGARWALKKALLGGSAEAVTLREGCLRTHPKWSKRGDWVACMTDEGLTLVAPEGGASKVIGDRSWLVFGWDASGSTIYGVKQTAGRGHALASINVATGAEKIIGDLKLPPYVTLSCFSMARDGKSFLTSVDHPTADLWIVKGLDGYRPWWRKWRDRVF